MELLNAAQDYAGFILIGFIVLLVLGRWLLDKFSAPKEDLSIYTKVPSPPNPFEQQAELGIIEQLHHKRNAIITKISEICSEANNIPIKKKDLETRYKNDTMLYNERMHQLSTDYKTYTAELNTINDLLARAK